MDAIISRKYFFYVKIVTGKSESFKRGWRRMLEENIKKDRSQVYKEKLSEIYHQNEELVSENEKIHKEKEELQSQCQIFRTNYEEVVAQNKALENQNKELVSENEKIHKGKVVLQSEILFCKEVLTRNKVLENQNKELISENENLYKEKVELQSQCQAFMSNYKEVLTRNKVLKNQNEELVFQSKNLKKGVRFLIFLFLLAMAEVVICLFIIPKNTEQDEGGTGIYQEFQYHRIPKNTEQDEAITLPIIEISIPENTE